ncbi:hypothetical protein [Flavobacterium suncheonense]|uniref:Phage protein D n=1 Tax=Flavobacterium suncheonense GH29-5 = DSM 17707 TaxID=1121899 RepID=A0A0A2MN90_9FLAO|nr:hypothetical protein [Flavobacterium suncheonense]KGO89735.1 hypothetical protein Q764_05945 [Flavobacterium suncheonense GH29-5 = DSM 17707]
MYNIIWDIKFKNEKGETYSLKTVETIEVECSVDNLADIAFISIPDAVNNQVLSLENKIGRGTEVTIKAGYDKKLETEFEGYITEVQTNNSTIRIVCEDALFLFRKAVKDVELKPTSVKKIAEYIVKAINPGFKVVCDFDIAYEKFVIHKATGYDVLKKIAEETKANIFFDTTKKELHIHPPYVEKGGDVIYSYQHNIESASLEYKKAIDRKVEVTVESVDKNGKVQSYTNGTTGGDKVTLKVGAIAQGELKRIADAELIKRSADGYEGSLESWLIPMVKPTYSAKIYDRDYPEKTGKYYVVSVKTSISSSGGKRTVQLGVKLST